MKPPPSHEAIQGLLAAYALDAVDPDEAELVEAHLRECPRCRVEVAEHRETASLLATGHAPAPLHILERVLDSLEDEPPPQRLGVIPLRPRRWQRVVQAAIAVAAAIALVALGVRVIDQDRKIDRMQAALEDRSLLAAALAAQGDPSARRVELQSAEGVVLAHAVLVPDGTGYLLPEGLPELAFDRTYQLWAIVGTARISAGLLGSDPGVAPFRVAGEVKGLAITEETAGGVVISQNEPVAVGLIT